ncbi:MAG: hypothetical protein SVX43_06850 [Cyanobacteriota bacterium]|nr:hypothetical protein [Cyanobacteriota bacterium]
MRKNAKTTLERLAVVVFVEELPALSSSTKQGCGANAIQLIVTGVK